MEDDAAVWITAFRETFAAQRTLAERAIAQLDDADLFRALDGPGTGADSAAGGGVSRVADAGTNSVAVLMKHVGGNLRSRWTLPFETDGEKPDRDRDGEFDAGADSAESIRRTWAEGWRTVLSFLDGLAPADAARSVRIRGEPLPLPHALSRSLAHTSQHVGQIVLLARQWRGAEWQTLSIPKGRSAEFLTRPPA